MVGGWTFGVKMTWSFYEMTPMLAVIFISDRCRWCGFFSETHLNTFVLWAACSTFPSVNFRNVSTALLYNCYRNCKPFQDTFRPNFSKHMSWILALGCVGLYSDVSKVQKVPFFRQHFDKHDQISAWLKFQPNRTSLRGPPRPFCVTKWFY